MAKTVKKRKLQLTVVEKELLLHPPTDTTWICEFPHKSDAGANVRIPNPGSSSTCWLCGSKKPKNPQKLWPEYLKACEKVGIEPGWMWKQIDAYTFMKRKPKQPWERCYLPGESET